MNARTAALVAFTILMAQLVCGCALFDSKNEDLPQQRRVRTVLFPVRHLEITNLDCTQEYENMKLSGSIRNVSPYALSNVRIQVVTFFAGEARSTNYVITISPSPLWSGQAFPFSFETTVENPIALVELHPEWDQP